MGTVFCNKKLPKLTYSQKLVQMDLGLLKFCVISVALSLIFHAIYVFSKRGIQDVPNNRSLHSEITKKSGGMVFVPLFLALLIFWTLPSESRIFSILYGCLFFGILGFIDDIYHLSPNVRLFLEFCFSFVWTYFFSPSIVLFGFPISNLWISTFIVGFLLVFVVNLVNFMDGLDLYLIGTFQISVLFWIPIFSLEFLPGKEGFLVILLLLVSLSGFAFFNFPKAKLFMGDSGSLAMGFLFICLPLVYSSSNSSSFELTRLFFLFPVFWIDGILTIIIRAFQKQHILSAHRQHLYQLLTETKLGKPGTCLVVILSNAPALLFLAFPSFFFPSVKITYEEILVSSVFAYTILYTVVRTVLFQKRKNLA